jgi:hypothetical protein
LDSVNSEGGARSGPSDMRAQADASCRLVGCDHVEGRDSCRKSSPRPGVVGIEAGASTPCSRRPQWLPRGRHYPEPRVYGCHPRPVNAYQGPWPWKRPGARAPSAGLSLGGLLASRAHLRFTRHQRSTATAAGGQEQAGRENGRSVTALTEDHHLRAAPPELFLPP